MSYYLLFLPCLCLSVGGKRKEMPLVCKILFSPKHSPLKRFQL